MAHYALIENGKVASVIVADADVIATMEGRWVQTSYNTLGGVHYAGEGENRRPDGGTALRGNFAGIGYTYDEVNDVFYNPQPFPSWTISGPDWQWKPPISRPEGDVHWDEPSLSWKTIS